jgi:hypothetical protein
MFLLDRLLKWRKLPRDYLLARVEDGVVEID